MIDTKSITFNNKAFDARNTYILSLVRSAMESGYNVAEAVTMVEQYSGLPEDIIDMALTSDFTFDF